jgi:hypothetical protein
MKVVAGLVPGILFDVYYFTMVLLLILKPNSVIRQRRNRDADINRMF